MGQLLEGILKRETWDQIYVGFLLVRDARAEKDAGATDAFGPGGSQGSCQPEEAPATSGRCLGVHAGELSSSLCLKAFCLEEFVN